MSYEKGSGKMPEIVYRRILSELAAAAVEYWSKHPDESQENVVQYVSENSGIPELDVRTALVVHDVEPAHALH